MNLFEMISRAGGGQAFDMLARRYGLEAAEVERAVEATMPAFSAALRRSTSDPAALFDFARAISAGRHAAYYEDPRHAFAPSGIDDGDGILGHLFGSRELSRAVAEQVHRATGLAETTVKQMLPVLAAMLLGGLYRQSRSASNPALDALLRQFEGGDQPTGRRGPLDRYEDEQEEREGRFMRQHASRSGSGAAAEQPTAGTSGEDVFGEFFQSGQRMGEAYRKNMEALFDRFLSEADDRR